MLESMIMGAFPIQSSTADTRGWIEDGRNGLIVRYDDIDGIVTALRRAISDDQLVDEAANYSAEIALKRLKYEDIRVDVIRMYLSVYCKSR